MACPVIPSGDTPPASPGDNVGDQLGLKRRAPAGGYAVGSKQPLTHYHSRFSSLVSWEDPKSSAVAYLSAVSLIVAVRYLDLIGYFLKASWLTLGAVVVAELAGKATTGRGLVTTMRPRNYVTVSEDRLRSMIGDIHELVNFVAIECQRVLFVENVFATAGAFAAALSSYYLVKVMPYWGIALAAVSMAFLVPPVYASNQELIDDQIRKVGQLLDNHTRQMREVAGKHTSNATAVSKQYLGDYMSKAQTMMSRSAAARPAASAPAASAPAASAPAASADPISVGKEYRDADFPAVPQGSLNSPNTVDQKAAEDDVESPAIGMPVGDDQREALVG